MESTRERFWWSFGLGLAAAVITAIGTGGDRGLIAIAFVLSAAATALFGPTIVSFFQGGGDWS